MTRYLRTVVVGGDQRYGCAVKELRHCGLNVKTWGVPGEQNEGSSLKETLRGANLVLLPMKPFLEDCLVGGEERLEAGQLPGLLEQGATLIAGSFPADWEAWFQNQGLSCVSLLEMEGYQLKNAAVTAEGAVYLSMKYMERTLAGARVLLLGWGRIGGFLGEKLRCLGANVTVAVRREAQRTGLMLRGYGVERLGQYGDLSSYDLVINTVPARVMTEEQFENIRADCTVIELSSLPGGFPETKRESIIMAQALPGKTAPKTAGENLAEAVLEALVGEGRTLE